MKFGHLIGNADVDGSEYLEIRDPGRIEDIVGRVVAGTASQAQCAVDHASDACVDWSARAPEERAAVVEQIAGVIEECAQELEGVLQAEQGMLIGVVRQELKLAASEARNTVEEGLPRLRDQVFSSRNNHTILGTRPYGVVAAIVPWNAPIILSMNALVPALLAGNSVVLKPSELAPLGVNLLLRRLAPLFPPGVLNLVNGGPEVSQALVRAPAVRKVAFTGGAATARRVMSLCADTLKDVLLELGGNDPAIVLDDADLETVVPDLVQAAFRRSGQYCFAVKRIYVARPLYPRFVEAFCAEVDRFRVGHPKDPRSTMGPVISRAKVEHIQALVADARQHGARIHELGSFLDVDPREGHYLRPVVVSDARDELDVVAEEQFGPVAPILVFDDERSVVQRANATEYGLCGSVWSADPERAETLAVGLQCGRVYINSHRATEEGHRHMPFGGFKQSGIGWTNGAWGVDAYLQHHSVDRACRYPSEAP